MHLQSFSKDFSFTFEIPEYLIEILNEKSNIYKSEIFIPLLHSAVENLYGINSLDGKKY